MKFVPLSGLALLLASTLAGCASTPPKSAEEKPKKDNAEYVYYTPTGSRIPVRVRKDQVQTTESQTTADQNLVRDLQQRGSRAVKDN